MVLQATAEKQLGPILELVKACQKRKPCPDFGTLRSWAQAAQAARRPATGQGNSAARQDVEARIEVNLEGRSIAASLVRFADSNTSPPRPPPPRGGILSA